MSANFTTPAYKFKIMVCCYAKEILVIYVQPRPCNHPVPDSSLLRCTLFNWLIGTRFLTIRFKMRFFPTRLSLSVLAVSAHELAMVTCGISSLFKRWLLLSLRPIILNGVPRGTRTPTLLLRRQLHHPIMLLAQVCAIILAHF